LIATRYLEFGTRGDGEMVDVTSQVGEAVRESGISSGAVVVFVPGATGAVTTIEHEPGLVKDLGDALERIAPEGVEYFHNLRWGDEMGNSLCALIHVPSLTDPF
jgi:thiamine phosphate synthase YjbQ (UPF0047 family)